MGHHTRTLLLWAASILTVAFTGALTVAGCAEEIAVPFSHDAGSDASTSGSDTQGTSGAETDLSDTQSTSGAEVTPAGCGNGTQDDGEQCDEGPNNSNTNPNACRADCTQPRCGDGVIDANETCDNGALNSDTDPRACRTNCTQPRCGNGIQEAGEQCDAGAANSDSAPDACRGNCVLAFCGDGVQDSGEQCDDANTVDSDECANACVSISSILCQPCTADDDCGRPIDTCETGDSGQFCATACDPDASSPCPDGYDCIVDPGEENRIGKCLPTAGECREVCGNGLDDDADTLTDCADPDCSSTDPRCGSEICDDQFDNDQDTFVDCRDSDCIGTPACLEDCTDNDDNDLDTLTDCADIEDCANHPRCQDACANPDACPDLPSPVCANETTVTTFSVDCVSNEGIPACSYPGTDTVCPNDGACSNGACVSPCAPSASTVCPNVPASTCANATTVTTYAPACAASAGQPVCTYPSTDTACPPSQACVNGACSDPCNPNPCTNIPATSCTTDTTISTYTGVCTVSNGQPVCAYNPTTVTCPSGQVCSNNSCVDRSSLPQPSQPGQVIFSEVMLYPNRSAQYGQWFELYNTTNNTFNLEGCFIYDNDEDFQISVTRGTLIMSPHEYAVLNGSSTSGSGLPFIDFAYSGSDLLMSYTSGSSDTLRLACGPSGSITIDTIAFNRASQTRGYSWNLDPDMLNHTANDTASNWCRTNGSAYTINSPTEYGTPGEPNTQCP